MHQLFRVNPHRDYCDSEIQSPCCDIKCVVILCHTIWEAHVLNCVVKKYHTHRHRHYQLPPPPPPPPPPLLPPPLLAIAAAVIFSVDFCFPRQCHCRQRRLRRYSLSPPPPFLLLCAIMNNTVCLRYLGKSGPFIYWKCATPLLRKEIF